MKVIAVIPAYHEATRIQATLKDISREVDSLVVVDDGSKDGTSEAVQACADQKTLILRHWINRGQGAALRTGTEAALQLGADIVLHIDADGQHDPASIREIVKPLRDGSADVVFGSRFLGMNPQGMPLFRKIILTAARTFNALVMGIPRTVTDPQSGLRAMTRDAAMRIAFRQDRMAHCSEILRLVTRSSLKWIEVPVQVRYSAETLAKGQNSLDALKIVWQLLIGMFD